MKLKLLSLCGKILLFASLCLSSNTTFAQTTMFRFGFESVATPSVDNVTGTPTFIDAGVTTAYAADAPCEGSEELRGSAWATGDYYRIAVNTTGYKDLVLSYCNHSNTTNVGSFRVRVSPGNTSYTTVVADYVPGTSNAVVTSNQFPAALNNVSTVWIEIYKVNNANNTNNRLFLDDVVLTGTPLVPQLTGFSPAVACPGAAISITGAGFVGATGVSVNNTAVASFTVNSASSISATLAAGTTSGTVKVTNANGTVTSAGILSINAISVSTSFPSVTICSGSSAQLNASASSLSGTSTGSNNTAATIPDNNATGISSAITVPATCATANNISAVTVNITHSWNEDLDVYLVSPSGTALALFTDKGGDGNNVNATFQTGGTTLPASGNYSISGTYAPQTAFSGFSGVGAGTWTLRVLDDQAQDVGTLNSWSITLTNGTCGAITYSWSPSTGLSSASIANPIASPTSTQTYTVTATNGGGCSATATSQVVVDPVSVGGSISGGTSVCAGANSGTLTLSGQTGTILGWESSTNNFATAGTPIANTTNTLSYSNVAVTTQYRALVKSGVCSSAYSAIATVSIISAPIGGSVATTSTICYGNNSGTLTLSGYTGTISGWESSLDNFATAGTPIANTSAAQSYSGLTATTSYRAIITNGCTSVFSSAATLTVDFNTAWTGVNGTSWHDAANWTCGVVPNSALNVTIPATANQPVINANAQANTLTVQNAASLVVASSNTISVIGAVDVQGTGNFTIENNANLIQSLDIANTGNVVVKRNSSALMRQDYTLWSSPVSGQNLLAFSPQTLANRFYTYNSGNNQYNTVASPASTAFAEAQGYLIRMPNNHPTTATVWNGQFTGVPNNGNVTFTLSNAAAGFGYNAIGNPYPSAIDMETFVTDNSANITGTLYFWRKTNNSASPSYCSWTSGGGFVDNGEDQVFDPNGILRTGQGFIVEASPSATSVSFNNAQRVTDNANQFFRSATQIERNRIWLNATGDAGAFSQTLVGYITGATLDIDNTIDGRFFNDGEISFYSLVSDERMVIQGRPLPFADNDVVPMGFKAAAAGNYSIAIDHVDGLFEGDQDIFLRDNATNAVHDLKSGPYSFASDAGTFNSRFEILYQNALSVGNPVSGSDSVIVYKDKSQFVVNSGQTQMASLDVYDVRGRLLFQFKDISASEFRFAIPGANQMLILKVRTSGGIEINKKVMN